MKRREAATSSQNRVALPQGWALSSAWVERNAPEGANPAAVSFITTEHFVLQGARAATISESNGRASVFLGALSGGLVALGFVGSASHLGAAFYTFGLVLLPSLALVGLTAFFRVFEAGLEDAQYAYRIAHLRAYYFHAAPEV